MKGLLSRYLNCCVGNEQSILFAYLQAQHEAVLEAQPLRLDGRGLLPFRCVCAGGSLVRQYSVPHPRNSARVARL